MKQNRYFNDEKIIKHAILAMLFFSVTACSSGGQEQSLNSVTLQTVPLNPYVLASRLGNPDKIHQAQSVNLQNARSLNSSGTGMSDAAAASGIIADVVPGAGPVFGPINVILGAFGANAATAALQDQIDNIDNTLSAMQIQIDSLQTEIASNNSLYQAFVNQQDGNNACGALQNLDAALRSIFAANSNYLQPSTSCGSTANNISPSTAIGNQFLNLLTQSGGVESAANNSAIMQSINALSTNNYGNFQTLVNDISSSEQTSTIAPMLSDNVNFAVYHYISKLNPTTTDSDCTTTTKNNSTAALLVCSYQYFVANMLPTMGQQTSNVVPNINNYNQQLFNVYQQNLLALQYAYTIEATSNYLNYRNYFNCILKNGQSVNCSINQIRPWEGVQAISFSVGNDVILPGQISANLFSGNLNTVTNYFVTAQQNLAIIYAARVNALYHNVVSFAISDAPLNTQVYTPPPNSLTINGVVINFAPQSYFSIPAATLSSTTTSGSIPGGNLNSISNGMFYQYSGINQLWSCIGPSINQALSEPGTGTTINLNNCVSAFPNSSSSYYDGVNMQAYGADSGTASGGVQLTNMLNMLQQCIPISNLNSLSAVGPSVFDNDVLQCGFYGGTNYVNSTVFPGSGVTPPVQLQFEGDYNIGSSNEQYGVWSSTNGSFYFLASTKGNTPGGTNSCDDNGGNFWMGSNNNPPVAPCLLPMFDGGFGKSPYPNNNWYHYALLQTTLPNGYVAPFYFGAFAGEPDNTTPPIYANIVCPMIQTLGSSCETVGEYITYTTQDGNQYIIQPSYTNNGQNGLYLSLGSQTQVPPGSYVNSCIYISYNSSTQQLVASCLNDEGNYTYKTSAYVSLNGTNCSNINGQLSC